MESQEEALIREDEWKHRVPENDFLTELKHLQWKVNRMIIEQEEVADKLGRVISKIMESI